MNKKELAIVGVDPDSDKHGIAIYSNGKLLTLAEWALPEVIKFIVDYEGYGFEGVLFSIENVMFNNFIYGRNENRSKKVQSEIARRTGRCQQSQVELVRMLEHHGIKYQLHKPQLGNWAGNKPLFEKVTGWQGRSNKDTRSAAFFGYLALQSTSS